MSENATGTFDITGWDEKATEERTGAKMDRVIVGKVFQGDLTGTSTTELLSVHTEAGPAAYVALEHFEGTLHGRQGTFVLQHSAGATDGVQWLKWQIVPTSGTSELKGLRGEGQIIVGPDGGHSYTLGYELD
ncbi:DUF3224 domain-containing protein [Actinomadura alba]|nr:DUF3224 domain-containing protein [Actinomadura alba]